MAITDDILTLAQIQDARKVDGKEYLQAIATPAKIPVKDSVVNISKLNKPADVIEQIDFVPTAKDYQFRVDVWTLREKESEKSGYIITSVRDLGDGMIETITKKVGEEITIKQDRKDG